MKHLYTLLIFTFVLSLLSQAQNSLQWYNPQTEKDYIIHGSGFPDQLKGTYERLPESTKEIVRKAVYDLSTMSAGLSLNFTTNSKEIYVRYQVKGAREMHHMPLVSVSGVDLYAQYPDKSERWCPPKYRFKDTITYSYLLPDVATQQYELFLPGYNQVAWLEIGVREQSDFKFLPRSTVKPITVYGSSIVQGACASRPGMFWSNILKRKIDLPVVNLGFSGNALFEPEVIDLVCQTTPQIIILDNLPNAAPRDLDVYTLVIKAVEQIRTKTDAAIILVDYPASPFGGMNNSTESKYSNASAAQHKAYATLLQKGIKGLYYLSSEELMIPNDGWVDGIHPSDLGMEAQAVACEKVIRKIMVGNNN